MIRARDHVEASPEVEVIPLGQCEQCRGGSFRLAIQQGQWLRTCTTCQHQMTV